jgi:hypothetical protein
MFKRRPRWRSSESLVSAIQVTGSETRSGVQTSRNAVLGAMYVLGYAGFMALIRFKYRCDKTGLTYEFEGWHLETEDIPKINEGREEVPCSMCGGKHVLFVEEDKSS